MNPARLLLLACALLLALSGAARAQTPDSAATPGWRVVAHDTVQVQTDENGLQPVLADELDAGDSVKVHYQGTLSGTFSSGGVQRLLVLTGHTLVLDAGRLSVPVTVTYTLGSQGGSPKEDEFHYLTAPSYDCGIWRFYNDIEYETSRLLGINSRFLVGGGPAIRLRRAGGNSLVVSNLVLLETTYYADDILKRLVRNSTRVKLTLAYGPLSWATTTFVQPSLVSHDMRVSTTNTLSVKIQHCFSVVLTGNYRYESVVAGGRNHNNLLTTVGVAFTQL